MATINKPVDRMVFIRAQDARKFIQDFNRNKPTDEFINSCKKAGELFNKKK